MPYHKFLKPLGRGLALAAVALLLAVIMTPHRAEACGICDPISNIEVDFEVKNKMLTEHTKTRKEVNAHTDAQFQSYEDWLISTFFKQNILPAMAKMTEQMSAVAMQQLEILGTFLDAKHQLETERLFQQLAAQAHKDFSPSEGMCTLGTAARSLASADRNGDLTALVLSRHAQQRQLMNANSSASRGRITDRESRAEQFKNTYCDVNDNNKGLTGVCASGVTAERKNKDIDFARTLWSPLSLKIDLSDATATPDETDIIALESNLYSHSVFEKALSKSALTDEGNQQIYMNMRAITAKRSVAENSFQALAAMKAQGTTDAANTAKYLQAAMQQLNPGMTATQAQELIGANPSYYAQMEILTKKLLQDPQFFTDLYDKPANVERKGVALQAISLMQDRDYFKSNLRSEAILSVLLEMEVANAQKGVQNQINRVKTGR